MRWSWRCLGSWSNIHLLVRLVLQPMSTEYNMILCGSCYVIQVSDSCFASEFFTSWADVACFRFCFFLVFDFLDEEGLPTSCYLADWKGFTFSSSNASKAFLVGVSVGGEQYVRLTVFCRFFQPAATCSGGKRFLFLSGGSARSQLSCLTVALLVSL